MVVPDKNRKERETVRPGDARGPEVIAPHPEAAPVLPETFKPREVAPQPEPEQAPFEGPEQPVRRPLPTTTTPLPSVKDEFTTEIEDILSADLTDLFLKMSPSEQEVFKQKGEETASKIRQMLASAKMNMKKVFQLIRDWLKLIPGVNRFFLEQEAKIKTDKILLAAEERNQQGRP